jgi:glycerol uptake facilitator-like aquaporin
LFISGKFPWYKLLHYFLAQYLGAFLGASLVFGVYNEAIDACEAVENGTCGGHRSVPATAGIFATYPAGIT